MKKKKGFYEGETVRVDEDTPSFGATDHAGEIGFITEIIPYLDGFLPPFMVDFGNREIEAYYDYELEKVYP